MNWKGLATDPLDWRSAFRALGALVIIGGVIGIAIIAFGLYNVSARKGHWPGISWVLHTTFRNAVALRAHKEPPAELMSDDRIKLGAGHFDSACKDCHGAPGQERSATVQAMTPEPPHISEAVRDWEPAEFHWIVHEGVKMSGMPGWPAERGDDVWPAVSFLIAARNMTGDDYTALTEKPDGQYCAMCHGQDGVSGNGYIPRLDILSEEYIASSLEAYEAGTRDSGIMAEAISHLPEQAFVSVASAYAKTQPSGEAKPFGELEHRGEALAAQGADTDVPACQACHGPWPERLNPKFPSLAGQYSTYIEQQLKLWRDGNRGGGRASQLMYQAARELTDEHISALAAYYATLSPAKLNAVERRAIRTPFPG